MGKGFNNYMCKKFFHPASRDNLKRVWMAEQKADSYKKKQEELRVQYEKEQDLYTNKAMLSKESKDKLSVNFMYEPPPGTKKEREREDDEPEYKFEWQRKFNAPREDYCKGDSEIRDQPFGIQVRNVRCIKCHKWGHINTDKECPMYNQSSSAEQSSMSMDPLLLVQQMREDGLAMKRGALGLHFPTQHTIPENNEDEPEKLKDSEIELLRSLTKKQKQKLLKKFKELEKGRINKKQKKSKKKSKKHKHKQNRNNDNSSSSESDIDQEKKKSKKGDKLYCKEKGEKGKKRRSSSQEYGEHVEKKIKRESKTCKEDCKQEAQNHVKDSSRHTDRMHKLHISSSEHGHSKRSDMHAKVKCDPQKYRRRHSEEKKA